MQWKGSFPRMSNGELTKADIGPGLKVNLLKYGSSEIGRVVNASSSVLEPYIDMEILRKVYDRFLVGSL